ncbi:hypothetical protein [Sphingomonas sp. ACRSK]|uniref:hypothetical protein n=1 Tax=Sphingomonas sp. ACRSK TaxID=2918213 RepID=UPI001EF55F48|nr:hypothetical protein [Sphingomonas sp. ACRSK]MCG7348854.1 hypothetical protein [Sphingomonas sp. ACRSK]
MIDYTKPVQTAGSKRRLFVTGYGPRGSVWLDTMNNHAGTGFLYLSSGEPVDGCPWGQVENVPEDSVFLSTEWVDPKDAINTHLREKRAAEFAVAAERDHSSNPLWGMF